MSVPTKQKALFIVEPKGDWRVRDADIPEPSADQVLVRVEAAALNPVDWKVHDKDYFVRGYPAILGFEGAGVVVKVGENVRGVVVGDRV